MPLKDQLLAIQSEITMNGNHVYRVKEGNAWMVYAGTTGCIDRHMPQDWMGGWFAKEMYLEAELELKALWRGTEARYKTIQENPEVWIPDLGEILGILKTAKGAARRKSGRAKDRGTDIHGLAEWWFRATTGHEELQPEILSGEVKNLWGALHPWLMATKPILSENMVFSRKHRVAGTFDLIAEVPLYSEPPVIDFKSWNYQSRPVPNLKPEFALQSHAYRGMIRELTGVLLPGVIVVLPKDKPRPAVTFDVPWDESCWEAFLALRKAAGWLKRSGLEC